MHELSLAESLVTQVSEIVTAEGAQKVVAITLLIGELSGVDRDAFEFVYPMAVENTILENARLVVNEQPARVACRDCAAESTPILPVVDCRHCGSTNVDIISGRDFRIQTVEIL